MEVNPTKTIELIGYTAVVNGQPALSPTVDLGTENSYGVEYLQLKFGEGWGDLTITATFTAPDKTSTDAVVDINGLVEVPHEATCHGSGRGVIVFKGCRNGVQLISCDVGSFVTAHGPVNGSESAEPTPDKWQQFVDEVQDDREAANKAAQNAAVAVDRAEAAAENAENAAQTAADAAGIAGQAANAANKSAKAVQTAQGSVESAAQSAAGSARAAADSAAAARKSAEDAAASSDSAAGKAEESASSASAAAENAKAAQTAQGSSENAAQTAADAAGFAGQAAGEAAQSAEAAETAKQRAEDAAKKALEAKTGSENALQDADAAKDAASGYADAAARSANSAADSAAAAKKSAEDADNTANSIKDSMTQIAANKEAVSQLKEDIVDIYGEKYAYDLTWHDGGYIDSKTGEVIEYRNWKYTDYIKIGNEQKIIAKASNYSTSSYNAFYDSTKKFISSFTVTGKSVNVPSNATYMRFSNNSAVSVFARIVVDTIKSNKKSIDNIKNDTAALKNRQNVLVGSEKGNPVSCNDAYSALLCGLTVYGKSTQDGTPTPDAPVPIVSAGDGGTVVVKVSDGNGKEQTLTLQTPTGLPGIPVTSNGNYTDQNGQQWVCDEVDLERGVKVQRVTTIVFSDKKEFTLRTTSTSTKVRFSTAAYGLKTANLTTADSSAFCSALVLGKQGSTWTIPNTFAIDADKRLYVRFENINSLDELQQYLQRTPMSLTAILATPIETPLTSAEIAAYKALTAYAPDTVVQASDGAGVKLEYQRDVNIAIKNLEDAIASMTTT